ncbi:phasin family protein [Pseudoxanthomonas dokdonensis]|uniref:Poly(Hydroxyalcanoate) granule associated protein n=1 Tax=Pseudoxanthomonas dokdonensis TaxID=344882 RepID=A0A0R0CYA1_9GAMM|nr:phasin family protein [Pseudoxanthomonas dokdonensis]KRG71086.1 hypothetical protein ABB29_04510 [Pseudoxanthomonas dokdonensis]
MATVKKPRKPASSDSENFQQQAEHLSRSLGESAQQVWLAGVGAFARAQAEGSKLFETLAREGAELEQSTRRTTQQKVEAVREAVEASVGQARDRASDTWGRLEKVFEQRVQQALRRLDVPGREDMASLIERVDELNAQLRELNPVRASATTTSGRARRATATPAAAARKAPRSAVKRATVKTATAKPANSPARKSVKKVAARKPASGAPRGRGRSPGQ